MAVVVVAVFCGATARVAVAAEAGNAPDVSTEVRRLWSRADEEQSAGRVEAALELTRTAAASAEGSTEAVALRAEAAQRLATLQQAVGAAEEARAGLDAALAASPPVADRAALHNARGLVHVGLRDLPRARADFEAAEVDARAAGNVMLALAAHGNLLRARIDGNDGDGLSTLLLAHGAAVAALPASTMRAELLIGAAELLRRSVRELNADAALRVRAAELLATARDDAIAGGNLRLQAFATGDLGACFEDEKRTDEALQLTRQALAVARRAAAAEAEYRFEWQAGRLLMAAGRDADALAAYRRSVTILDQIRPGLQRAEFGAFARAIAPVYGEYSDLVLRAAARATDAASKMDLLHVARGSLESLKQAEVEDYFARACVASRGARQSGDPAAAGVAIYYPVVFADRIELLVEAAGVLEQFSVPVPRERVEAQVDALREALESVRDETSFLAPAQALYGWLLAPIAPFLERHAVTTVVAVPDGSLRTVPLAAFHDGERFFVERYAVAVTPAMRLTSAGTEAGDRQSALIGGLSKSVGGLSALPSVPREVAMVVDRFGGTEYQDETFVLANVEPAISRGNYTVAHFATHGEFEADYRQSFIQLFDARLTLGRLESVLAERRRGGSQPPLDLLVLSACRTAAGDDRAALGLAGVAVQSGAESALASLWYISDAATVELMEAFYEGLLVRGLSKAQSLREAQVSLMRSDAYSHPEFWAPFLLIGDWR